MATAIDMAQAVVDSLSEYGAELCYAPDFELPKMRERRVVVVPSGRDRKIAARGAFDDLFKIDVGVVHKCKGPSGVPDLVALAETIGKAILGISAEGATCVRMEWEPLYSVEHLRASGVFLSVMTFTFRRLE